MKGYRIRYPVDYYGQWEAECTSKGRLAGVVVEIDGHGTHQLTFIDRARLLQCMDDQETAGANFFTEHGLVLVTSVTRANIESAIAQLHDENFW